MLTGRAARGTTWRVLDEWIDAVVLGRRRRARRPRPAAGARRRGGEEDVRAKGGGEEVAREEGGDEKAPPRRRPPARRRARKVRDGHEVGGEEGDGHQDDRRDEGDPDQKAPTNGRRRATKRTPRPAAKKSRRPRSRAARRRRREEDRNQPRHSRVDRREPDPPVPLRRLPRPGHLPRRPVACSRRTTPTRRLFTPYDADPSLFTPTTLTQHQVDGGRSSRHPGRRHPSLR